MLSLVKSVSLTYDVFAVLEVCGFDVFLVTQVLYRFVEASLMFIGC